VSGPLRQATVCRVIRGEPRRRRFSATQVPTVPQAEPPMTTAQISMGTSNRASRKPRPLRIPAQQPSTDGGSNATSAEAFLHNRGAPHGASSGRLIPRHRRGIHTCRVGRWVHRHAGRCTSHVGLSCEAFWSLGGDSPRLVCFASRGADWMRIGLGLKSRVLLRWGRCRWTESPSTVSRRGSPGWWLRVVVPPERNRSTTCSPACWTTR
jgi:hypothetical protein